MLSLHRQTLIRLIAGLFACFGMMHPVLAATVPSWFNPKAYDFSISLGLGSSDIDRVFDSTEPVPSALMQSLGIGPGHEYYAWMTADQPNQLLLTSWTGFTPGPQGTQLLNWTKIESDQSSSPLGDFPALLGSVRQDGGLMLIVCSVAEPDCRYQNTTSPEVNYTLFFEFAPTPILPALPLFASGLTGLALLTSCKKEARHKNGVKAFQIGSLRHSLRCQLRYLPLAADMAAAERLERTK